MVLEFVNGVVHLLRIDEEKQGDAVDTGFDKYWIIWEDTNKKMTDSVEEMFGRDSSVFKDIRLNICEIINFGLLLRNRSNDVVVDPELLQCTALDHV